MGICDTTVPFRPQKGDEFAFAPVEGNIHSVEDITWDAHERIFLIWLESVERQGRFDIRDTEFWKDYYDPPWTWKRTSDGVEIGRRAAPLP